MSQSQSGMKLATGVECVRFILVGVGALPTGVRRYEKRRADIGESRQAIGELPAMEGILRFSGSMKRDRAIDAWFCEQRDELRPIAEQWFEQMRQSGGDVRELMHDGCPVACVREAPFGYVATFRVHVNVGFFRGARLDDPAGLLEGSGKRMRHVKLRPGRAVDEAALQGLISAAYADIRRRLE